MTPEELKKILRLHGLWARKKKTGKRANLSGANLSWADLSGMDFSGADLYGANLSWADLSGADLSGANLSGANLSWADLSGANLSGVNLDFSVLNLSCKGLRMKVDKRFFSQLVYHLIHQYWQDLTTEQQDWLQSIPDAIANGFCEYRTELPRREEAKP